MHTRKIVRVFLGLFDKNTFILNYPLTSNPTHLKLLVPDLGFSDLGGPVKTSTTDVY